MELLRCPTRCCGTLKPHASAQGNAQGSALGSVQGGVRRAGTGGAAVMCARQRQRYYCAAAVGTAVYDGRLVLVGARRLGARAFV